MLPLRKRWQTTDCSQHESKCITSGRGSKPPCLFKTNCRTFHITFGLSAPLASHSRVNRQNWILRQPSVSYRRPTLTAYASVRQSARSCMKVSAHQTLTLRALFRQLPHGRAPEVYYSHVDSRHHCGHSPVVCTCNGIGNSLADRFVLTVDKHSLGIEHNRFGARSPHSSHSLFLRVISALTSLFLCRFSRGC